MNKLRYQVDLYNFSCCTDLGQCLGKIIFHIQAQFISTSCISSNITDDVLLIRLNVSKLDNKLNLLKVK